MMPINVKLKTFTKEQPKCRGCLIWGRREIYHCTVKSQLPKPLDCRKMIFSSACLPTPSHIVSSIDKMVTAFVWNNKPAKIKRESMIGPKESGGLDLPDYESIKNSLLVSWVKRMIDGKSEAWMAIPSYYLENVGELSFSSVIMMLTCSISMDCQSFM